MFGNFPRWKLFIALFAVLTVGIMALFFNIYEPWQPIGSELIPDGSFSTPAATNSFSGWNEWTKLSPDGGCGGSPGVVLTATSNRNGTLRFTVYNLTNIPAFRASLRAAAHGVARGKEGYHVPKALFYYRDANGKSLFNLHHGIMDITKKDTGWRYYKDFFPVPKGTIDACFHVGNAGVAGVMQVDDLSVIPVRARSDALWWKCFFGTLWTAAFGLCLAALRPWARRYGFLIMATLVMIMIGIILPGKPLDDTIEKTAQAVKHLMPKPAAPASPPGLPIIVRSAKPKEEVVADKPTATKQAHVVGHFIMFSLLAFLSALSWLAVPASLKRAGAVFAGLAFFAAATEVLQFIPSDRSAGLSELRIDLAGMAGAVVLIFAIRCIQRLIRRD